MLRIQYCLLFISTLLVVSCAEETNEIEYKQVSKDKVISGQSADEKISPKTFIDSVELIANQAKNLFLQLDTSNLKEIDQKLQSIEQTLTTYIQKITKGKILSGNFKYVTMVKQQLTQQLRYYKNAVGKGGEYQKAIAVLQKADQPYDAYTVMDYETYMNSFNGLVSMYESNLRSATQKFKQHYKLQ